MFIEIYITKFSSSPKFGPTLFCIREQNFGGKVSTTNSAQNGLNNWLKIIARNIGLNSLRENAPWKWHSCVDFINIQFHSERRSISKTNGKLRCGHHHMYITFKLSVSVTNKMAVVVFQSRFTHDDKDQNISLILISKYEFQVKYYGLAQTSSSVGQRLLALARGC